LKAKLKAAENDMDMMAVRRSARAAATTGRAVLRRHCRVGQQQRTATAPPRRHQHHHHLSERARTLAAGGGAAARVWEEVNALAAQPGMVNMGQGFPDFPGSAVARKVAQEALEHGSASHNQYSPQPGMIQLREAVAAFHSRRYGSDYEAASEVVVTAGAQEGLAAAFSAFLDPGDEVILCEPFYPFMMGAVRLAGAVPRVVTLRAPGFAVDDAALAAMEAAAASPRCKMLVLNSPHNPTGHVATAAELEAVASLCVRHDLLAVADEVYEHCVFPPPTPAAAGSEEADAPAAASGQHLQLCSALDGAMRERTITLGSGGKLFSLTGWRVAWAVGPAPLLAPLGTAHTHMTFSAPTPLQAGVAAALADDGVDDELRGISELFAGNFAMLSAALREMTLASAPFSCSESGEPGLAVKSVCEAQGGYFLVAETQHGVSDVEFCRMLAKEKQVACTPMSVFYATEEEAKDCTLVRFTICKSREHIQRACDQLLSN
jgi:N-succinyldiaminopimelate aminotransferase